MPQVVQVTEASGLIAAHVLNSFCEAGIHVRATVRSGNSATKVHKTHAAFSKKFPFVIVPDISAAGAFNDAVKGVDELSTI